MNVFDLFAKLVIDTSDYDKGLKDAEVKADNFSKKSGGMGNALKGAMKIGGAALAGVATGVAVFTKKSVDAYSEYEQLLGGVQKLYGNMGMSLEEYAESVGKTVDEVEEKWGELDLAQDIVQQNADRAFQTAGMSANKYLETATSFSAALIGSLDGDTVRAAELTDKAMIAIADNWNTFGGDLEGITNAFKGFSKQNYTMLDNLKLGYGGTQSEMQRLIDDANKYAKSIGQTGKLTINSFADIVTAIDLVQQKQNIAGTTAREASSTIGGSIQSMKAAWENLVTGFANPDADIGKLIENMVEAGKTALENIVPAVKTVLSNLTKSIKNIAPIIVDLLTYALTELLPELVKTGGALLTALVQGIIDNADKILQAALDIVLYLGNYLAENASAMIPKIVELMLTISQFFLDNIDKMIDVAIALITGLATGLVEAIPILIEKIPEIIAAIVGALIEGLPKILDAALEIMNTLVKGFKEAIPKVKEAAKKTVEKVKQTWEERGGKLRETGKKVGNWFKEGYQQITSTAATWGELVVLRIKNGIGSKFGELYNTVTEKFGKVRDKIKEIFDKAREKVEEAVGKIKNVFNFSWHLPELKVPKFRVLWGQGLLGLPKIELEWHKKAYETPYLFTKPTVVGNYGFGDGGGSGEIVYGRDALLRDIREASTGNVTINVYTQPGQNAKEIAEMVQREFVRWNRQRKMGAVNG